MSRPPLPADKRRQSLTIRLTPDVLRWLEKERRRTEKSRSRIVEKAILEMIKGTEK